MHVVPQLGTLKPRFRVNLRKKNLKKRKKNVEIFNF